MYSSKISVLLPNLLFIVLGVKPTTGFVTFTELPMNVEVHPESPGFAVFSCRHDRAQIITWLVNDTILSNINASNITACTSPLPIGLPLHTLKIATERAYNMTEIACLALFLDGSPNQRTPPAYLLLRDDLEPLTNDFLEIPASLNVSIGEEAAFYCQHCTASRIDWRLNGTLIRNTRYLPSGVEINYRSHSHCGMFVLIIRAVENYNQTYIQCEANINDSINATLPALLLVQGVLSAVSNLQRISTSAPDLYENILSYSWHQPHSLDVTNAADPDIIYCVHVYRLPCSSCSAQSDYDTIVSTCNVTETYINATVIDKQQDTDELFGIEVLSRINLLMNEAPNGTSNFYHDEFVSLNDTAVTYNFGVNPMNAIQIQVVLNLESINPTSIKPKNISSRFMIVDPQAPGTESGLPVTCLTSLDENISDDIVAYLKIVNCPSLKADMLYMGTLVVTSTCCQISNPSELSTHFIQNVTIAPTLQPSEISVSCTFVNSSGIPTPSGFLAIAYSSSGENSLLHYGFMERSEKELDATLVISGLYEYEYRVSVFALKDDGLPFNRSVTVPQTISNVTVREGHNRRNTTMNGTEDHSPTLMAVASQNSSGNCTSVKCTFADRSANSCAFIVTNKSQASNEYGILYIDVFDFERNGDTAVGCLPIMNITDVYIDVISIGERRIAEINVVNIVSSNEEPPNPSPDPGTSLTGSDIIAIIVTSVAGCATVGLTIMFSVIFTTKALRPPKKVEPKE